MKLDLVNTRPNIVVTIYGQYDYERNTSTSEWKIFPSEDELNDYIYKYIIYLDLYDAIENCSPYKDFNCSVSRGLKQAVKFYFENEHKLQLPDKQFNEFFNDLITDIPYSEYAGYNTIPDESDIEIVINNNVYNIDYDEEDVKEAIDKLVNHLEDD